MYCFNYRYLDGNEWHQVCTVIEATDIEQADKIAKEIIKGQTAKDEWLVPYERLVRV